MKAMQDCVVCTVVSKVRCPAASICLQGLGEIDLKTGIRYGYHGNTHGKQEGT